MLVNEDTKQIGTIAKESGVPIKTIRYYEEIGLIKASSRTEGGFRLFSPDVLSRLHFIKSAQNLGLSLLEIKDFLQVHDQGNLPCEQIQAKLHDKVAAIDKQIQDLLIFKHQLEALLSTWEAIPESPKKAICPIIERN